VFLEGQFGVRGVCLGVPVVVGRKGVEKVVGGLQLTDSEHSLLQQNAELTKSLLRSVLGYSIDE
jgi:malate dehydrogenase